MKKSYLFVMFVVVFSLIGATYACLSENLRVLEETTQEESNQLKSQISNLKKSIASIENENNVNLNFLRGRLASLKVKNNALNKELLALKKTLGIENLKDVEQSIAALNKGLKESKVDRVTFRREIAALKKKNNSFQGKVASFSKSVEKEFAKTKKEEEKSLNSIKRTMVKVLNIVKKSKKVVSEPVIDDVSRLFLNTVE